jgi:hypothetical protein
LHARQGMPAPPQWQTSARSLNIAYGRVGCDWHTQPVLSQTVQDLFITRIYVFNARRLRAGGGCSIVYASGRMPRSTARQVTGAATGNPASARGE